MASLHAWAHLIPFGFEETVPRPRPALPAGDLVRVMVRLLVGPTTHFSTHSIPNLPSSVPGPNPVLSQRLPSDPFVMPKLPAASATNGHLVTSPHALPAVVMQPIALGNPGAVVVTV